MALFCRIRTLFLHIEEPRDRESLYLWLLLDMTGTFFASKSLVVNNLGPSGRSVIVCLLMHALMKGVDAMISVHPEEVVCSSMRCMLRTYNTGPRLSALSDSATSADGDEPIAIYAHHLQRKNFIFNVCAMFAQFLILTFVAYTAHGTSTVHGHTHEHASRNIHPSSFSGNGMKMRPVTSPSGGSTRTLNNGKDIFVCAMHSSML